MEHELSLKEIKKEWHGTLKAYIIGLTISFILTLTSFSLVILKITSGQTLVYTLITLALIQAVVQLLYFLHLGQEAKPQWETFIFCFMVLILLIIAFGSLWIMHDLNDRMMSNMPSMPSEMRMTHD